MTTKTLGWISLACVILLVLAFILAALGVLTR